MLFVLVIIAALAGPTTNERLQNIENQMTVLTCLALIPDEERVARGIAECQTQTGGNP